ncbi:sensor histidine kinase [Polluticoccus soli]|uniref:sensor histidine kinase n=1 Tax=Polluticoccus soli TaxID=3034150 RepID=UPI0023E2A044|nr:histidine kinase [Flavipsychrobacter sp. JY13-12]
MRAGLLIIFSLVALVLRAQKPFMQDAWLNEQNIPVKVNAIARDGKGYHWLATDAGLCRFNGRSFVLLQDSVHKPATALTVLRGVVFVGYSDGSIGHVNDENTVVRVRPKNAAPSSSITSLHSFGGVLWICTEGEGIFIVVNGNSLVLNTTSGLSDNFVYTLALLPDNHLLAGTDKGINELWLREGKLQVRNYTMAQGLPDNIVRVIKPIAGTGLYWCGMQQAGLVLFDGSSRKIIQPHVEQGWQWGQVNDILPVDSTRAWVVTEEGYLLETSFNHATHQLDVVASHMPGKRLKGLLIGRSGVIRIATNTGLTLVSGEYMRYIDMPADYKLGDIQAMTCDKQNNLWYASGSKLYTMPLGNAQSPHLVAQLPGNITCLYADKDNRVWIGTFGNGVWYYDADNGLVAVKGIVPLQNESVLDIAGTSDRLWVAGLNGVEEIYYSGIDPRHLELLRQHNKNSGVGSDYIYQLYPDSKGRVWMATDGAGVCMYNEGRYARWDSTSGMTSKVVYSVVEDAFGNIWAATLTDGLYRFDGDKWISMRGLGMQDANVSTIAANASGQVVVVNAKGVDIWYPQSGLFRNYPHKTFGIDSASSVLKLSARDSHGNVYIPFEDGFIVFKNVDKRYDIRPAITISSTSVFFEPVPSGTKDFKHDQNHISFRFEGINFANPERLHYRYKLEGYNDRWIVTNDESVTFPQLPDGDYTFRVQASLNDMFHKASEARYSFTIARPFWKHAWFIMLVTFFIGGLTVVYVRLRESNLRKVSSLQRERMMFEYEHLKSQVNPHFLFNSLNTLASLIEEDRNAAVDYTTHLSDLYRNMLSFRDKDLISLEEEWEILENYLFIQKSRFGEALRVHFNVSDDIRKERKIVPLALQLLVENAIKHNIVSMLKPLDIVIETIEDSLVVKNSYQPKLSKEKGAGLGLINIKKRYALLSKKHTRFGIRNNEYVVTLPLL